MLLGCNPEQMTTLERAFLASAALFEATTQRLDSTVATVAWTGSDAIVFRDAWSRRDRVELSAAAQLLRTSSHNIRQQLNEQLKASNGAPAGSRSGNPGGGPPSPAHLAAAVATGGQLPGRVAPEPLGPAVPEPPGPPTPKLGPPVPEFGPPGTIAPLHGADDQTSWSWAVQAGDPLICKDIRGGGFAVGPDGARYSIVVPGARGEDRVATPVMRYGYYDGDQLVLQPLQGEVMPVIGPAHS